jgi:hypothetical protein
MAFSRYDPKTKDSIIKAATEVRAAGKTWREAHAASKAAGYKGSLDALDVMIRNTKKKAGKAKPKAVPAKAAAILAKPATGATVKSSTASRYDPKEKAAFIKAALDARAAGKTWRKAHADAKAVGYKGKLKGLDRMIRVLKKKAGKTKVAPALTAKVEKKPGQPASIAASGYDPVHKMIDQIVRQKLRAVVEKAIAELRKAVE